MVYIMISFVNSRIPKQKNVPASYIYSVPCHSVSGLATVHCFVLMLSAMLLKGHVGKCMAEKEVRTITSQC